MATLPAYAETISSTYSRYKGADCPIIKGEERLEITRCSGKNGLDVIFYPQGHRAPLIAFEPWYSQKKYNTAPNDFFWISYGYQWAAPFENSKGVTTFEWRVEKTNGNWMPFAVIIRFSSVRDGGTSQQQHLAVVTLGPNGSCVIGGVDALTNKNANVIAREIADTKARTADCRTNRHWLRG